MRCFRQKAGPRRSASHHLWWCPPLLLRQLACSSTHLGEAAGLVPGSSWGNHGVHLLGVHLHGGNRRRRRLSHLCQTRSAPPHTLLGRAGLHDLAGDVAGHGQALSPPAERGTGPNKPWQRHACSRSQHLHASPAGCSSRRPAAALQRHVRRRPCHPLLAAASRLGLATRHASLLAALQTRHLHSPPPLLAGASRSSGATRSLPPRCPPPSSPP